MNEEMPQPDKHTIDAVLENCRRKVGKAECRKIAFLFVDGVPDHAPSSKIMELVESLISSGVRMYLNEIRDYLLATNRELYERYAEMFRKNPGSFEAFGIQGDARMEEVNTKPKVFRSLRPQLHSLNTRDRQRSTKRTMGKNNKALAYTKVMKERQDSREYKKKMSDILERIRRN